MSTKSEKHTIQFYSSKISATGLLSRKENGNCVDRKKVQILGPTRIGRQAPHGYRERKTKSHENNWKLTLNAQDLSHRWTEGKIGGRESHQELATEAIPRTSSSRTAVGLANVVKFTFLFFIGMDRIAILVDLLKVGGLPLNSISCCKEFRLQEMAIPL